MLESMLIQNFQKHRKAGLEFCPGINVISGTSDVGKSSIIRALLWALINRPAGFDFRSWGAAPGDAVTVSLAFDDHFLDRLRSEKINSYVLDGQQFVAMKAGVPDEIADILNIGPVNIQTQFMSHYLLAASPGEVSRTLNEACDLTVIDTTLKAITTIATKAKSDAKFLDGEIEAERQELESLAWVLDAEIQVDQLEQQVAMIKKLRDSGDLLDGLICDLKYTEALQAQIVQKERPLLGLSAVKKAIADLRPVSEEQEALSKILSALTKVEVALEDCGDGVLDVAKTKEADALILEAGELRKSREELRSLLVRLADVAEELEAKEDQLICVTEELDVVWAAAEICPICDRPLNKRSHNHV